MRTYQAILGLVICGLIGFGSLPSTAQIPFNWELVNTFDFGPHSNAEAYHIDCADADHCIYSGFRQGTFDNPLPLYSYVIRTTDGGKTWSMVYSDTVHSNEFILNRPRRVAHPSPELMLVATQYGLLLRSTDGGVTWRENQVVPDTMGLDDLSMCDERHGVMLGGRSILFTEDGGESWQSIAFPDTFAYDVDPSVSGFVSYLAMPVPGSILVSGRTHGGAKGHGCFVRTEDRGKTWSYSEADSTIEGVARFVFIDSLEGWGCGMNTSGLWTGSDLIVHTTDGGMTWEKQVDEVIDPPHGIANIAFVDRLHGLAGGGLGKLLITENGGRTWENISLDRNIVSGFWGVAYPSRETAYALGGNGTVTKLSFGVADVQESSLDLGQDDTFMAVRSGDQLRISCRDQSVREAKVILSTTSGRIILNESIEFVDGNGVVGIVDISSGCYLLTIQNMSIDLSASIPFLIFR